VEVFALDVDALADTGGGADEVEVRGRSGCCCCCWARDFWGNESLERGVEGTCIFNGTSSSSSSTIMGSGFLELEDSEEGKISSKSASTV
jgi:hypothetical protein